MSFRPHRGDMKTRTLQPLGATYTVKREKYRWSGWEWTGEERQTDSKCARGKGNKEGKPNYKDCRESERVRGELREYNGLVGIDTLHERGEDRDRQNERERKGKIPIMTTEWDKGNGGRRGSESERKGWVPWCVFITRLFWRWVNIDFINSH